MHPAAPARRRWLAHALPLAALAALPGLAHAAPPAATPLEVWKDPHCGCCNDWVAHMQAHGFAATVHDTGNAAVRARLGLPQKLGSCHTALVGGYLLEGHVPAQDVQRLLREKPQALGLAVPGMPVGSPGMDGALYGGRRDPYEVLLVAQDGSTRVFSRHPQADAASTANEHAGHHAPAAQDGADGGDALSEGEIVRWNAATGRLTLRHGELKNLAMPPMTMAFRLPEPPRWPLAPGTRVRFRAEERQGALVITRIETR